MYVRRIETHSISEGNKKTFKMLTEKYSSGTHDVIVFHDVYDVVYVTKVRCSLMDFDIRIKAAP